MPFIYVIISREFKGGFCHFNKQLVLCSKNFTAKLKCLFFSPSHLNRVCAHTFPLLGMRFSVKEKKIFFSQQRNCLYFHTFKFLYPRNSCCLSSSVHLYTYTKLWIQNGYQYKWCFLWEKLFQKCLSILILYVLYYTAVHRDSFILCFCVTIFPKKRKLFI